VGVAALALFAGGCASNQADIPADADMVAEGNKKLTYQVPRDGTVYVYDDDANRLIYTGEVRRGQTVSIDSADDDIMIDGRRATEWDLDPDHRIQIYFDDDPTRVGRRRIVVEEERRTYSDDRPVDRRDGSWNP
jgi:hypothetical protein